jgi:adenine phosphoribosyltransferase
VRFVSQPSEDQRLAQKARALVRDVPDYPEPGVVFKDITPVLADPSVFAAVVEWMASPFDEAVDMVAGIEARGFILGAPVAHTLGVGFVPIRKTGKLPGSTVAVAYDLEYGQATLEMQADALGAGQRVLVVDDVIATGGTVQATVDLIRRAGAEARAVTALLSIRALRGTERLEGLDVRVLFES